MSFRVIRRSEWGARPAEGSAANRRIVTPAPELFIHHTDGPTGPDEAAIMRGIQAAHMRKARENGWRTIDIAYNFVEFPNGLIFEGRGWGMYGNHTQDHNTRAHAICFAGKYMSARPTAISLDAARWLISEGKRLDKVAVGVTIPTGGHRDVAPTACPGNYLYARIPDLRTGGDDDMALSAHEEKVLKDLVASIDHIKSNGTFAQHVIAFFRSHPRSGDVAVHPTSSGSGHSHDPVTVAGPPK